MSPQWGSGGAPEQAFLPGASSPLGPSSSPPPPAGPGIGFGAGSASKAVSSGRGGLSSALSSRFPRPGPCSAPACCPAGHGREAGSPEGAGPGATGRLQVAPRGSGPRGGGSRSWGCGAKARQRKRRRWAPPEPANPPNHTTSSRSPQTPVRAVPSQGPPAALSRLQESLGHWGPSRVPLLCGRPWCSGSS